MKRKKSSVEAYGSIILSKEENVLNFTVKYELFEKHINNEKTFCLRLSKKENDKIKPPSQNNAAEEAVLNNFESRKETAISIYNALIENKVTPMCLYDSVLELI